MARPAMETGPVKIESPESLLLVFDSSRARFYRLSPAGKIVFLNEVKSGISRSAEALHSDKPGTSYSSAGPGRSAIEPKHDPHKQEKHNFVHELAALLDTSHDRNEFRELVVAAPERSIGEFRKLVSENVRKSLRHEVPKELLHYPDHEIETRLRPLIGL
jgi:protein required for attachment to host cells